MLIVATAGHVDHGKSTLVRALTGTDPDRLAEERRRGLTIELGYAWMSDEHGGDIAFVDVPGHRRFIRTMLAGVGAIDACMLVVDAGEGWRAQTEEHFRILELLGHSSGVVALTKVDAVGQEVVEQRREELRHRLLGSFLADSPIVGVSARDGHGLRELRVALEDLAGRAPLEGAASARTRLWVDRSFVINGAGTVATGTLTDGSVEIGEQLVSYPGGAVGRIRSLESLRRPVSVANEGERVAVGLAGVTRREVVPGSCLVPTGQWHLSRTVDAALAVLDGLGHDVSRRGAFAMYVGSASARVRLRVLRSTSIESGATGLVRLHLDRDLPLQPGDRYVLRDDGRSETVGGGQILEIDPLLPASVAQPTWSADRIVAEHGWIDAEELFRRTGERRQPDVARWCVAADAYAQVAAAVRAATSSADGLGLAADELDERSVAIASQLEDLEVAGGRVRIAGRTDELDSHPMVLQLQAHPFDPPAPDEVDTATWRELVRRGLVVRCGDVTLAGTAVQLATELLGAALAEHPDGLTVAEVRDVLGSTRRVVVPLLEELDRRGVTVRRSDRRAAGPALR